MYRDDITEIEELEEFEVFGVEYQVGDRLAWGPDDPGNRIERIERRHTEEHEEPSVWLLVTKVGDDEFDRYQHWNARSLACADGLDIWRKDQANVGERRDDLDDSEDYSP